MARNKQNTAKSVETLTHDEAKRRVIPTAEHQPLVDKATQAPLRVAYERRNRDLDPQLVWRGKDTQDTLDLMVKALIEEFQKSPREHDDGDLTPYPFADFNGLPRARTGQILRVRRQPVERCNSSSGT